MTTMTISRIELEMQDGVRAYPGRPWGPGDGPEQTAEARIAKFTTPDATVGFLALTVWPEGERDLRVADILGDPGEYGRLQQAGTLAVKSTDGGLVAMLKAMRYGPRGYAKLENVEWGDIDVLAGGDAAAMLADAGATAVGRYGDLYATSAQYAGRPGIRVAADAPAALFAAFALTRIVPILVGYGRPGVEVIR